jgi:hypothetical protein
VRFSIDQAVAVAPEVAIAAYANPAFYRDRPPGGDIAILEVTDHEDSGPRARIDVRYRFTGSVSAAVRAIIDPAKMSWVTRTDIDKEARRTSFRVLPDHYPDRLECSGSFRFAPGAAGAGSTALTVEGDLKVRAFLVGRTAEQLIVSGLRAYLVAEAATLPEFDPT